MMSKSEELSAAQMQASLREGLKVRWRVSGHNH